MQAVVTAAQKFGVESWMKQAMLYCTAESAVPFDAGTSPALQTGYRVPVDHDRKTMVRKFTTALRTAWCQQLSHCDSADCALRSKVGVLVTIFFQS